MSKTPGMFGGSSDKRSSTVATISSSLSLFIKSESGKNCGNTLLMYEANSSLIFGMYLVMSGSYMSSFTPTLKPIDLICSMAYFSDICLTDILRKILRTSLDSWSSSVYGISSIIYPTV